MSEIAISLKNVSKCFKRYGRPIDRLKELLLPGKSRAEFFWALQDINLTLPRGETLGIVGKNGSGKSTLLQIIAGTLTPTTGKVEVNGRVSALLELGSGFNPEFTGRQNVFFNGRLLGLSQGEIENKFDNIARFADIGDFIEQPVKTYSSGMFVRLAFAVAINVEPDILVVDEALAVGDEAFQRKCFAQIQLIKERGGTILFVSHSAALVVELCKQAILLDRGKLLLAGAPKQVVSKYQKLIYAPNNRIEAIYQEISDLDDQIANTLDPSSSDLIEQETRKKQQQIPSRSNDLYDPGLIPQSTSSYVNHGAEIENPHLVNQAEETVNVLTRGDEYIYTYTVQFSQTAYQVRFGMMIKTVSGLELGGGVSHTLGNALTVVEKDSILQVRFKFNCYLQPNMYFLNAGVTGIIDGAETFLARYLDIAMFRVQLEEDILETGIINFQVEPSVLQVQPQIIGKN